MILRFCHLLKTKTLGASNHESYVSLVDVMLIVVWLFLVLVCVRTLWKTGWRISRALSSNQKCNKNKWDWIKCNDRLSSFIICWLRSCGNIQIFSRFILLDLFSCVVNHTGAITWQRSLPITCWLLCFKLLSLHDSRYRLHCNVRLKIVYFQWTTALWNQDSWNSGIATPFTFEVSHTDIFV